jgi:hypothetical protein
MSAFNPDKRAEETLLQGMQRSYAKAIVKHPEDNFDKILTAQLQKNG